MICGPRAVATMSCSNVTARHPDCCSSHSPRQIQLVPASTSRSLPSQPTCLFGAAPVSQPFVCLRQRALTERSDGWVDCSTCPMLSPISATLSDAAYRRGNDLLTNSSHGWRNPSGSVGRLVDTCGVCSPYPPRCPVFRIPTPRCPVSVRASGSLRSWPLLAPLLRVRVTPYNRTRGSDPETPEPPRSRSGRR